MGVFRPNGLNTYAAYYVMRGALDPTGMWTKIDRQGQSRAKTISDDGDNKISTLAKLAKLNAAEIGEWIHFNGSVLEVKDSNGKLQRRDRQGLQPTDDVCPGQIVTVPNEIHVFMGPRGRKMGLDIGWLFANDEAKDYQNDMKKKGFEVTYYKPKDFSSTIANWDLAMKSTNVFGMAFFGHGGSGELAFTDTKQPWFHGYRYKDWLNPIKSSRPRYKIGSIVIFACDGADGKNHWKARLSDYGKLYAPEGTITGIGDWDDYPIE